MGLNTAAQMKSETPEERAERLDVVRQHTAA